MDTSERGSGRFEQRQGRLLVIEPQRLLALFPGVAPGSQQPIVQPAALVKLLLEEALLLLVWIQATRERLTHASYARFLRTRL